MSLALLALCCLAPEAHTEQGARLDNKIAVLEELAAEGVAEAAYRLYHLIAERRGTTDPGRQALELLAQAAGAGHPTSLHRLGYHLFESDSEQLREGLTLLATAALLGNDYARLDLALADLMAGVPGSEIAAAIERAARRLEAGSLLDCDNPHWSCTTERAAAEIPIAVEVAELLVRDAHGAVLGAPSRAALLSSLPTVAALGDASRRRFEQDLRTESAAARRAVRPQASGPSGDPWRPGGIASARGGPLQENRPAIAALIELVNRHRTRERALEWDRLAGELEP